MIDHETYMKMQGYKRLGLSKVKSCKALGITSHQLDAFWNCDEREFLRRQNEGDYYLDNYREFIVNILKLCPQITDANISYKIREAFPEFVFRRATFYRYMKKLREQTGYTRPFGRITSVRPDTLPSYEAQVDFGQYRLTSIYGKPVRVYFFVIVMSYSRMKFVYFSLDPFTTETAIVAHKLAFSYFGGRTQTIMYD